MIDFERFDDDARAALLDVHAIAWGCGDAHVAPEHLLLAVLRDPDGLPRRALIAVGAPQDRIDSLLARPPRAPRPGETGPSASFTRLATSVVARAAAGRDDRTRTTGDLLLALLELRPNGATGLLVTTVGVDLDELVAAVAERLAGER